MYWKSTFDPEISAYIPAVELAVGEGELLIDSISCGDSVYFAVPSSCIDAQGYFFHVPATAPFLGEFISVRIQNSCISYSINEAFPSVMDLFVTVSSRISKLLSRVNCFVRRKNTVKSGKKSFTFCRPCVLRL